MDMIREEIYAGYQTRTRLGRKKPHSRWPAEWARLDEGEQTAVGAKGNGNFQVPGNRVLPGFAIQCVRTLDLPQRACASRVSLTQASQLGQV